MSLDLSRARQFELGDGRSTKSVCKNPLRIVDIQTVWSSCRDELIRLCQAYGYDRSTSEDICQEAFLSAWEKDLEIEDEVGLRRWLFRTTINRCHAEHRAKAYRKSALKSLKDSFARRLVPRRDSELHDILRTELEQLSHHERTALIMTYYQQQTSAEIAAVFGVPSSTVRTWIQTGRNKLAKRVVHLLEEE